MPSKEMKKRVYDERCIADEIHVGKPDKELICGFAGLFGRSVGHKRHVSSQAHRDTDNYKSENPVCIFQCSFRNWST